MLNAETLLADIRCLAREFAADRRRRQLSRALDPADVERLKAIGLHLAAVPEANGGRWQDRARSLRPLCQALRLLAQGDPSLALVASMHPAVLSNWRELPDPPTGQAEWAAQRLDVFGGVTDGAWWGTVTSEPGSGGEIDKTRATAVPAKGGGYLLSGEKHFGSGSGATTHVLTSARRPGAAHPEWFFMDVRGSAWDGSSGITLKAPWDGHGMPATNSHGFVFDNYPATRLAWPGGWRDVSDRTGGIGAMFYTAVFPGIIDAAMAFMRRDFARRGMTPDRFGAFEKVEWAHAHREAVLVYQAHEAALQAFERGGGRHEAALAKANMAELAASVMTRLCRIAGGGAFHRQSPLGFWAEDVRAAGYLRPPWAAAYEGLFNLSSQGEPGAMSIEETTA
jgi:alkylation response protein AidB-like acyl-CoA dehydrogenase